MGIKLVVFDLAGTTVDDSEDSVNVCFREALQEHEIDAPRDLVNSVMGIKKIHAIQQILKTVAPERATEETITAVHDLFLQKINNHYNTSDQVKEIDGVTDVFQTLKNEGIKVAFNTGFSRSTADIIANRLGWYEHNLIDSSACSDEVEKGRPYPYMIERIMEQLELENTSEVAKIGDTPSDLEEGKNANCGITIGVLYGTHDREELEGLPHDFLVNQIQDVIPLLVSQ
ncbi:MAG: HAD-IA family hydrolase [Bacteroidota bacterium]